MCKRLFIYLLPALVAILLAFNSDAIAAPQKNILILHSYHKGYKWTEDQARGIASRLDTKKDDLNVFTEYMGAKWVFNDAYFDKLHEMYHEKYRSTRFDLIMATDNDAYDFLRQYRNDIFGEVPVVFCGVNWFSPGQIRNNTLFTGVNEDADIEKNIDLMLQLHPATKHIYMIVDLTTTGNIIHNEINAIIPRYRDRVTIHILDDMELSEMLNKISTLSNDSLVLLTLFQKDKKGVFLDVAEIASKVSKKSSVPVYGLWDFYLGYGIVGGFLTTGFEQGDSAGMLALRILNGESAADIPVIMKSPNIYLFDFNQLKKYEIFSSMLPDGSVIINKPDDSYTIPKTVLWGLVAGITVLSLFTAALLVNIRKRILAEQSLSNSEEKYRSLVDNLTLGVYRREGCSSGKYIQVNPAMINIFGYESAEKFMNLTPAEIYMYADERNIFVEEIEANGFVKNKELLMKSKTGKPVWISVNARAHYDEFGKMDWIDGTAEDITERKKLEHQLRQAQKMDALGTLSSGIAHDFNNILTGIIGYACLMKKNVDKATRQKEFLDEILAASERASSLTRSLLAFSRKQEIETRAVRINEIILHFKKFMTRIIGEDIELKIETSPEEMIIMADSSQIDQVLMNLATNARDAMPNGGMLSIATRPVELDNEYVKAHPPLKPGRHLEISISDTGSGMDEVTQQKIFEPFFTTKEVGKGTGLGLSIIYGIIKQHNGEIIVYSEVGIGTTFKIYLPLLNAKVEESEEQLTTHLTGGNECILLIEDDVLVRNLQKEVLEQLGYKVIVAEDGEEAVAKFVENRELVQLLLLDIILPKKNGIEVYEEIRKIMPDIKVLFTSGYTADIIQRQGFLEKNQHFLSKPTTPYVLSRSLREILDN